MAGKNLSHINTNIPESKGFKQLIDAPKKKKVQIEGENNFGNNALIKPTSFKKYNGEKTLQAANKKRGRPVIISDKRYKVIVPKKISPALESKLNVLQDYIVELQGVSGRISFDKLVDTLAESYIGNRLSMSKEELARQEIKQKFEELK
ncbi:hypothetical protein QQG09_06115 [Melissococcus plutonius]|uniref:Uncharacterized protein n=2 Tax=Melissococcus plutonius TaxID=33970 RepID=F3YCL4_MELPT|nr:hypothetical protein [Melissococcus plutonius]BAL62824.1 hypothetical protein MPD5_1639 [Melissococcus plutonius DAT561]AIM26164.1 hypothetical protein MEPL_178p001400 [Melissococcus plutonius S1]KMT23570.1 hypothetical protein MEPL2_5c00860 [Melissococcus plutonius]KMT23620.1 hypothetical protein MEPL3_9c00100 [Melissococcus plutonius]KMT24257.1 hypothetical protein MEPL1_10c00020 [Melissococcus plutonius]